MQPNPPVSLSVKAWDEYRALMSGLEYKPECSNCGGLKIVRTDAPVGHPDFGRVVRCPDCAGPLRKKQLIDLSGLSQTELTHLLTGWRLGNWPEDDEEAALKRKQRIEALRVMKLALSQKGFYSFWGDFGGGKSRVLTTMVNEFRLRFVEAKYIVFVDVLDHLRQLFSEKKETSYFWEQLQNIPVLSIDEVTRFNETGWARERLFSLVNHRYRLRDTHLTLFATNDDPRQPLPVQDDVGYLYSRMREGELLELRGDMRPIINE